MMQNAKNSVQKLVNAQSSDSNVKKIEESTYEWVKIEPSFCEKLVRSIPNRLKTVRASKGLPTKY